MAGHERALGFLLGLAKFVALIVVAGGLGVALGTGLSQLSGNGDGAPIPEAETGATSIAPASSDGAPTVAMSTTPVPPPASPLAQVRVTVLGARLFTGSTPSGVREQRGRALVRVRAENTGSRRVALPRPVLRVGSVRVLPADPTGDTAGARFAPWCPELRRRSRCDSRCKTRRHRRSFAIAGRVSSSRGSRWRCA